MGSMTVTVDATGVVVSAALDDGKVNALTFDVLAHLQQAVATAVESRKPLLIAGRPGQFCAGFDLSVMRGGDWNRTVALTTEGGRLFKAMLEAPVPVVVACTGHALAAGALLLLSADQRVGAPGAFKIGLNEVRIGMALPPFAVALARERLDQRALTSATMLAEVATPQRAIELGYLDGLSDDPVSAATRIAERFADELVPDAFAATKARVRAPLLAQLEL
jgi:enoyl-CoA hydratase